MHRIKLPTWFFSTILLHMVLSILASSISSSHSRQKRLLWITSDGRLALPPGTTLNIIPTLSFPFVRHPPLGFISNMTITLPFTINFNALGLTDNENPYGSLSPLLARSMGRVAGGAIGNYVMQMLDGNRQKRSLDEAAEEVNKEDVRDIFHGGERALLFISAQQFLENLGFDGKACLLRAICEVHAHPMTNFGLFGEVLKLFFTASKSPYAALMKEYVQAEEAGRGENGAAECWAYVKSCPKSIFTRNNKVSHE